MTKKTDPLELYINSVGAGWCIRYLMIAIVEDEQGDQQFLVQASPNQTAAETIGLCEAVSHIQKAKIARAWIREEDETDDE
ncbi:MAG: hypothetical protein ACO33F_08685 [Ilumatobacteraceae bacterium]|jgi:hypothetical protein